MNQHTPRNPQSEVQHDRCRPDASARPGHAIPRQPQGEDAAQRPQVLKLGHYTIPMPASRLVRIALGAALVFFGLLGFLPILGFWMVPLGLLILSIDLPLVRRWRRRVSVWVERRWPGFWARLQRWTTPSHLRGDKKQR